MGGFIENFLRWEHSFGGLYNYEKLVFQGKEKFSKPKLFGVPVIRNSDDLLSIEMSCTVKCYPDPVVTWYRGEEEIESECLLQSSDKYFSHVAPGEVDDSFICLLKVKYPTKLDSSSYCCRIANKVGKTKQIFRVSLDSEFDDFRLISSPCIDYFRDDHKCELHFICAGITRDVEIQWEKQNGVGEFIQILGESPKYNFINDYSPLSENRTSRLSLTISDLETADCGIYICTVTRNEKSYTVLFPLSSRQDHRGKIPQVISTPSVYRFERDLFVLVFFVQSPKRPSVRWELPTGTVFDGLVIERSVSALPEANVVLGPNDKVYEIRLNLESLVPLKKQIPEKANTKLLCPGFYNCSVRNTYGTIFVPIELKSNR